MNKLENKETIKVNLKEETVKTNPEPKDKIKEKSSLDKKDLKTTKKRVKTITTWIFPSPTKKKKNSKSILITDYKDSPYLFQKEKDILDMWLTPSANVEDPKEEPKKESKDTQKEKSFLNKKRKKENENINNFENYRYNNYINKILGLKDYDCQNLDFIDGTIKEIANRKIETKDKRILLSKYLESKKLLKQFNNLYSLIKKEKEEEKKRIKDLEENPELIYEEEEEIELENEVENEENENEEF